MRKLFTLALLITAFSRLFAQTNVPNGDLENWYTVTVNANLTYEDVGTGPADNWMATLNSLAAVPAVAGGPGPVTVLKTGDKHSGNYAAKCVSANFPLGVVNVFIPGMLGTAVMETAGVRALLGKPCAECRPVKFKGYYKYEPVNGDSCSAILLLSKWNSTAKKRDTIAYGRWVQKQAQAAYTPFEVVPIYRSSGSIDSITLLVVSSAGFSAVNFMGAVGQAGSTMYVDDLMLEYPAGIEQELMPEVFVKAFPNPVSDVLKIELDKIVKDAKLNIYNSNGKLTGSYGIPGSAFSLPVYGLPNGIFHYKLSDGKRILNSGTFVINR